MHDATSTIIAGAAAFEPVWFSSSRLIGSIVRLLSSSPILVSLTLQEQAKWHVKEDMYA